MTQSSNEIPSDSPAAEALAAPRTLGEFRLLRKLGQGGMAEVWLAEQTSLQRRVALKLLKRELMQDARYVTRFQREASAAGGLNHPHIVQVHMVGEQDGEHYIAQEYVKGVTLKQYLRKKGPPPVAIALHFMRQMASALKAAADAGIVHRDIKPGNILITRRGEVKVADFGLAQLYEAGEGLDITQEGMTLGTPLYMSPEQVHGHALDPRSDLYALGVTCYHMLAGRPPFDGPTAMSIAVKHVQETPQPLGDIRPDLPPGLIAIVNRLLAKNREDRYQQAGDMLLDIRRIQQSPSNETGAATPALTTRAERDRRQAADRFRNVRRPAPGLVAVFVLSAAASACLGWLTRPADPLSAPPAADAGLTRSFASARDQFLDAMLLGHDADAFRAVIERWDAPQDRVWQRRALEQWALLALRDKNQWDEAEHVLTTLESYGPENARYRAEAVAGRAALLAYRGEHARSRALLLAETETLEAHLSATSPFRRLVTEAQRLNDAGRHR
jgi:serine/threonine-protein kinase